MTNSDSASPHDLTHWCDYARGVAEPATQRALRDRPAFGGGGARSLKRFRRVWSLALRDREARIPAYAERVVKAAASVQGRWEDPASAGEPTSFLRRLPFDLTFDSLRCAGAGTRDLSSHQRIVSYRAADFSVHVRLEQETNPHGQVVVGQLLRHGPGPEPVSETPVLVVSEGRIVGRSVTSRFGEFQADRLPPSALELCLLVGGEDCIDIPLGTYPKDA